MPDARRRLVNNAVSRPVQAECKIDILEVRAEFFGEHAHIEQGIAPIERTGSVAPKTSPPCK